MAENTKLTSLELNGVIYGLGRSIYAELDMSLERFVELLGRDFYCPTLAAAPTSSTITYKDTDDSVNTFQIGQPCRWQEGSAWRLAVCTNNTGSAATWYILPAKVSELTNDAGYLTQHQDISHLATKQEVNAKQDAISDLVTIRENASKGATALQSVPSEYVTETELTNKGYATTSALNTGLSGKVDKVSGKQLSTEDFTTALKNKLESLNNYDDATITDAVNKLRGDFDTLVSGDTTSAIESFNEIIAFLEGVQDSGTLNGIVAGINQEIAKKQDKIADLESIRSGAGKGTTAVQPSTLSAVATSGSYTDLSNKPTIPDSLSDLTDDASHRTVTDTEKAAWNAKSNFSGSYNDLTDKPTIPSAVTESTVSGWGFTKNTGTITGIKMNGASKGTSGVVDLGTVITAHQDISGKQDKNLYFNNKSASSWVASTAYADYGYQCDIACSGVTASMYAEVVFAPGQATSGNYAPVCETFTDKVRIYSKVNTSITIPTILIEK